MKILVNDHAGHPFQVQLSRALAGRGHEVRHSFTAQLQTPRGALERREADPTNLDFFPIVLSRPFSRYGLLERARQENELGRKLSAAARRFHPDVVVSANTPLGAQAMLAKECRKMGTGFVFWLQDLLGVGIRNNLEKKLPVPGKVVGRMYIGLEHRLLRQSEAVVAITEDFVPICRKAGVAPERIHVVENWAPLDEVGVVEKENPWSRAHGLDGTFNFIYSGTLGMKHNPRLLLDLARAFAGEKQVRVVVISEGLGAGFLKEQKEKPGLDNLVLMGFQPFEQVPLVQGAADVLVAILEPDAGVFAVPSKVLTYLCARRPLLLAVPPENLAARIVSGQGAGIVAAPGDGEAFIDGARRLWRDADLRQKMAANGRRYAEKTFDIERIADRFEGIIQGAKRK
ncbi:glycosyltransferase family 4 protein [Desulfoglaeba alkanexedens]|uniref:Glycosyltransferase family 4 protein n=1 Tax=Desulfoglaeba alkanexedens ALDC TaxID=980445 RepID=A0A4P8KZY1_9BACT|nr:glycosyltransferase family 4 protein [Desulfoglaeba alkanexedens]QCQ20843.1 glycosyltransferase family 4 protein [Desulfoglaeba alkanexedens ALDC]